MSKIQLAYDKDLRVKGRFPTPAGEVITDVSEKWGGLAEYPSPLDLFAASLGACVISVMGIKAKSLSVPLEGTTIEVERIMNPQGGFAAFTVEVKCPTPLTQDVAERLEKAAAACPVKIAINPAIPIDLRFSWNLKNS